MYFSKIKLRDWKGFTSASFEFPAPSIEKNIVLIGAPNGYGKTSLFEAIILCLFGIKGMNLISHSAISEMGPPKISYKNFMERALHEGAINSGRTSCSVNLTFRDVIGEQVEIQRIWHFNETGSFLPIDEEIRIFEGPSRAPVGPNPSYSYDRINWFFEYITEKLLPFTIAHFFLFDGEQVRILAERDKKAQVSSGIEELLGIPILKKLGEDLRKYAKDRRKDFPSSSYENIEKLEKERLDLTTQIEKKESRKEEIQSDLDKVKNKRDNLIGEITSYGAGTQALFEEQYQKLRDYDKLIENGNSELEAHLTNEIPLLLSGSKFRKKVKNRLISEQIRENWLNGKNQGDQRLDKFFNHIEMHLKDVEPRLSDNQCQKVLEGARKAWENLWYPQPNDCANEIRHFYLNDLERKKVIEDLDDINELRAPKILNLLNQIETNCDEKMQLQEEIWRVENIAPYIDDKRNKLEEVNGQISKFDQEIGKLNRNIQMLESERNNVNQNFARLTNSNSLAAPSERRAIRAEKVALMVDDIVKKAVPSQIDAIAKAMTNTFRFISNKKDLVEKIKIDKNCEVQLLNSTGKDLRDYDLSAGEKQIFTQSLISALSSVTGRDFPMVVDTPLGRLDNNHRKGVLKHLVQRNQQVILLSTDTEVVGEYLQEISQNVQKEYRLQFEKIGEIGKSSVLPGYLE